MPKSNNQKRAKKERKEILRSSETSPMPLECAFVVQFQHSESATDWFIGRVEHVMSGRNTGFASPQEVIEFFRQVMSQQLQRRSGGHNDKNDIVAEHEPGSEE